MIADTDLRDVRTDFGHDPGNLVSKDRRKWGDIVSSEQQVRVTQSRGLHVDEDFASDRRGQCPRYPRYRIRDQSALTTSAFTR